MVRTITEIHLMMKNVPLVGIIKAVIFEQIKNHPNAGDVIKTLSGSLATIE
jgi:hypothetical protein